METMQLVVGINNTLNNSFTVTSNNDNEENKEGHWSRIVIYSQPIKRQPYEFQQLCDSAEEIHRE